MIAEWFKRLYETTGINFTIFYDRIDGLTYLNGLATTAKLSVLCLVFSVLVGIAGAWLQKSSRAPVRLLLRVYIAFFRNTPPLAQLYFLYFGIGSLMPMVAGGAGPDRESTRLHSSHEWLSPM